MRPRSKQIKVLELVLRWDKGGVERYIETLVHAARKTADIECRVVSATTAVDGMGDSGDGPLVSGGIDALLFCGDKVIDYISRGGFDVVHVHGNNGLAFLFAHCASEAGAAAIIHSHNSSFGGNKRFLKRVYTDAMRNAYSRECSVRLACSHLAGDFLFGGEKYEIAKNGVDVCRFAFDSHRRESLRERMGFAQDAFVLGFAASLIKAKNPFFALKVFRAVLRGDPNAKLVICGDGPLEKELKEFADSSFPRDSCIFVGRVVDVESYYDAMDVLLAPSLYEGLPINLIEAQACNLPIIMSDVITPEVVVNDNLCSRLSLSDGEDVWSEFARRSFAHAENRAKSAFFAARLVSFCGYSQQECCDSLFDLYRSLTKSSGMA